MENMDFHDNLSESIKLLRADRNWTQEDLARELGISREAISLYESGKRKPSYKNLLKISQLAQVDLNSLIFGSDKPAPSEGK